MDKVARVAAIDLAKRIFHVTAVDADGTVLERKRLRRAGLQSYLAQLPTGAWWRWRRAPARTTGVVWRAGWATGRC